MTEGADTQITARRRIVAVVVLTIAVFVWTVLFFGVIPKFRKMYSEMEVDLPLLSVVVMSPVYIPILIVISLMALASQFVLKTKMQLAAADSIYVMLSFIWGVLLVVGLFVPLMRLMSVMQ